MSTTFTSARHGSAPPSPNWSDKLGPNDVGTPSRWYRRRWLRSLLFVLSGIAGIGGATAIGLIENWENGRQTYLARQRRCLLAFCGSPEFAGFAQQMDLKFVSLHNYITLLPAEARNAFPAVVASEVARGEMPWPMQVAPLPSSAALRPHMILSSYREIGALLAKRGHVFDAQSRTAARQMFLQTMMPSAQAFMQRAPDNEFNAVWVERAFQEAALAAYGAHFGPGVGVLESERLFCLYAQLAPGMERDSERADKVPPPALLPAPRPVSARK